MHEEVIMKTRYTVELSDNIINILNYLAEKQDVSKSEVFRRALSLYDYVIQEIVDKKLKLTAADEKDRIVKEIVMTG
jgi:predicted transcriptional regulator